MKALKEYFENNCFESSAINQRYICGLVADKIFVSESIVQTYGELLVVRIAELFQRFIKASVNAPEGTTKMTFAFCNQPIVVTTHVVDKEFVLLFQTEGETLYEVE